MIRDFLLLSLFVTFIFISFAINSSLNAYESKIQSVAFHLDAQAALLERSFSDSIDYTSYLLSYVADQIRFSHHAKTEIHSIIQSLSKNSVQANSFLSMTMLSWINANSHLIVNSELGILKEPADLSKRDYSLRTRAFPEVIQLGQPVLGKISNQWIIPASMGITSPNDGYIGAINVGLSMKKLHARLEEALTLPGTSFAVVDPDLNIILESTAHPFRKSAEIFFALDKLNSASPSHALLVSPSLQSDKNDLTFYYRTKYPYTILVSYDNALTKEIVYKELLSHTLEVLVLGVLTALLTWLLKQRIITPIIALSDSADQIAQGAKEIVTPDSNVYEIQNLTKQLNHIFQYTNQLRDTHKRLIDANAMVRSTLSYMAHELKTPLNQIIGFAEIALQNKTAPLDPKNREYLEYVLEAGKLQHRLIHTFLETAAFQECGVELREKLFDISVLIQERVGMVRRLASEKEVSLSIEMQEKLPLIHGDDLRLGQVIINLLSNAIKYNRPKGKVIVRGFLHPRGELCLQFIDTGIGIAPDDIETLFQKFRRIEHSDTKAIEGTGVGLYFCREMIELHGGSIEILSSPGDGSTFTVLLPASRLHPHPEEYGLSYEGLHPLT